MVLKYINSEYITNYSSFVLEVASAKKTKCILRGAVNFYMASKSLITTNACRYRGEFSNELEHLS